ncbi:MAG: glycoside hydrolase family 30 beta sandwich domain-containing protein [Bacteroidota bacterium]|nr:glycoside hydrolase family 30 beta sandwich domain-containing protein [Bacteroidota bacterium]
MKHLSHFVKQGASLLDISQDQNLLAFKNPDGTIVVVLANQTDKVSKKVFKLNGNYLEVNTKANSFNTLLFPNIK